MGMVLISSLSFLDWERVSVFLVKIESLRNAWGILRTAPSFKSDVVYHDSLRA